MDTRIMIIRTVAERLNGCVDAETMDIIEDVLTVELNRYEVNERCTDVAVCDDGKMLKTYIATKRIEGLSEATLRRYWQADAELLRFLRKPVREIETFDIRFFLSYKRETGVSNRTLDGMRRCFNSFFGWLAEEGMIDRNPCAAVKQIKYRKEVKKPFTAVEREKLRTACDSIRDLALVDFLYSSGCRVSEVSNLDISDVDFRNMECKVVGKGNKERIVYLSPVCAMHLQDYLRTRKDDDHALFVGKRGRLTKNGIETCLRRLGTKAGVDNVHPHRFRRTLATNLLDKGMPIQDVAEILGHADLKTTQIYCYISQSNVKASYRRFAA